MAIATIFLDLHRGTKLLTHANRGRNTNAAVTLEKAQPVI